jgi:peptidoglycan/LPS O-acetylase OafA/YrhL
LSAEPQSAATVASAAVPSSAGYRLGYRPDIEGLRAVAVVLVVAAHAGVPWLQGGFAGVDVFFVLSGFLITGLLAQEIEATGRVRLLDFYARRLRRLLPALLTMVIGSSLLAAVLLAPFEQPAQAPAAVAASVWLSNLHFVSARLDYFGTAAESNIFLHTWSLGVEEQFYLAWPLLVLFLVGSWRWQATHANWRRLRGGMAAVVVLCFVLSVLLTYAQPARGFYLMPSRAWQFALGALVALAGANAGRMGAGSESGYRAGGWYGESSRAVGGWIGIALVLGAGLWLDRQAAYPGVLALLPSLGTALILAAGARGAGSGVVRLLSLAPLQWLGRLSYAWYLWHWPVLILGATVVIGGHPVPSGLLVGTSLALALLSYYLVELPVRRSALFGRQPLVTVLGAIVLMSAAVMLGARWQAAAADWALSPAQQRYAAVRADLPRLYAEPGCDEWYRSSQVRVCGFGAAQAEHTVVLLGDSVTMQWFPAVMRTYGERGWRVLVVTKSACPMVDESYFYPRIGRRYTECEQWRAAALGAVKALRPDVVLTGSTTTYPFTESQWVDGSRRVLETLSAAAERVFVLRATPTVPFDGPGCLARAAWRSPRLPAAPACVAAADNPHEEAIFSWVSRAANAFPNVRMLDLNALICPDRVCDAAQGGAIVFRDSMHVTARYVATIADAFAGQIDQAD